MIAYSEDYIYEYSTVCELISKYLYSPIKRVVDKMILNKCVKLLKFAHVHHELNIINVKLTHEVINGYTINAGTVLFSKGFLSEESLYARNRTTWVRNWGNVA